MRIKIDNYTYESGTWTPQIGDIATLPTPSFLIDVKGPTWEGVVTALSSDYSGEVLTILGLKRPSKKTPKTDRPRSLSITIDLEVELNGENLVRLKRSLSNGLWSAIHGIGWPGSQSIPPLGKAKILDGYHVSVKQTNLQ